MNQTRVTTRLQRIEDRKNRKQALLFILLTIGFMMLLVFVGIPLFIRAAIFLGDLSSSSQAITQSDTTPPFPPKLMVEREATSSAKLNIRGYAEDGTTVILIINENEKIETLASSDGSFVFEEVELIDGENSFQAYSVDTSSNESRLSNVLEIVYDNFPPKLTILSPVNQATFFDEEREILISGETDPETDVRVNNYVVVVDNEGNFVKKLQLLEGNNEIQVTVTDKAGNKTTESVTVTYSR